MDNTSQPRSELAQLEDKYNELVLANMNLADKYRREPRDIDVVADGLLLGAATTDKELDRSEAMDLIHAIKCGFAQQLLTPELVSNCAEGMVHIIDDPIIDDLRVADIEPDDMPGAIHALLEQIDSLGEALAVEVLKHNYDLCQDGECVAPITDVEHYAEYIKSAYAHDNLNDYTTRTKLNKAVAVLLAIALRDQIINP